MMDLKNKTKQNSLSEVGKNECVVGTTGKSLEVKVLSSRTVSRALALHAITKVQSLTYHCELSRSYP